jgi:hypothetical protein
MLAPPPSHTQAAGSSLLAKLAVMLAEDALRTAGLGDLGSATVLPLATGMAITVTLLAIAAKRWGCLLSLNCACTQSRLLGIK